MAYRKGDPVLTYTRGFIPFAVVFTAILCLVRVLDWLFYRLRVEGRENLPRGGAILVSNHTLLFDPGIIAHAIRPRRTYFTMLEETALIPWLGTFVRLLGAVPIPERHDSLRVLDAATRTAVRELGFLHVFPEGECFRGSQQLRPFHPGAFLLACRLSLPVIPVTTVLKERLWRGRPYLRILGRRVRVPPRVVIVIGAPVRPPLTVVPADPAAGSAAMRRAARGLAEDVRRIMQETIDSHGGCKTMDRGQMPRLVRRPA
ncbi:MAG TPA: lysophospholipid acyltransferase family protein [Spirochaetia bacterium]